MCLCAYPLQAATIEAAKRKVEARKKELLAAAASGAPAGTSAGAPNLAKLKADVAAKYVLEEYFYELIGGLVSHLLCVTRRLAAMRANTSAGLRHPQATMGMAAGPAVTTGGAALGMAREARPSALLLDKEGRLVDASGKVVQMQTRRPDFIANIGGTATPKPMADDSVKSDKEAAPFVDERLPEREGGRSRKQFRFHEQGKFVTIASKQRAKVCGGQSKSRLMLFLSTTCITIIVPYSILALMLRVILFILQAQLEKLQEEIEKAAKKTGISSATKLALIAPLKSNTEDLVVPDVEWWDAAILPQGQGPQTGYGVIDAAAEDEGGLEAVLQAATVRDKISHLIQHPVELRPPAEPAQPPALPVMLTKKERKKMRTQRRKAEEKERQEKIRLGLMEAPAPKVKKANFMRVLGNDAVSDPTMVEKVVKAQAAIRQRDHTEANAARKLTKEQRKEKAEAKLVSDTDLELNVAVFRIQSLKNGQHKFKVRTPFRAGISYCRC